MSSTDHNLPLDSWLPKIIDLSKLAGEKIMDIYGQDDFQIQEKEDDSPLTAADLAAHNAIVAALEILTPAVPILSEESAKLDFETRSSWETYWLVDPLDGTKEFIKRNGEFTVNIALIHQHKPILGVVHAPATGATYYSAEGLGAFKQEGSDKPKAITVIDKEGSPLRVVGSRSHAGGILGGFLENVGSHEMVSMGSSLKLCLVAEGAADLYPRLGLTSEWDTAAAHAIVLEAGGRVTDTEMNPLLYNTKDSLLNPFFLVSRQGSQNWSNFIPAQ